MKVTHDAESYYATLAHETTHWTAHESRLARDFGSKRFGSEGYAVEELVAELAAAFLCADLDLALEPREDHVSYVANWLKGAILSSFSWSENRPAGQNPFIGSSVSVSF